MIILDQVVLVMASQKPQPSKRDTKTKKTAKNGKKAFTSEVDLSAKHLVTAAFKDIASRYL